MNTIIHEENFHIIGIKIRTNNYDAINHGTIQQLWHRFFSESIYTNIPDKIDQTIIALYYNFESDKHGQYDVLIGARVVSVQDIPAGMTGLKVPDQKRMIFNSEQGNINHIVLDLWKKIWHLEDQQILDRRYTFDYELYDQKAQNPESAQVSIHIGIK